MGITGTYIRTWNVLIAIQDFCYNWHIYYMNNERRNFKILKYEIIFDKKLKLHLCLNKRTTLPKQYSTAYHQI